MKKMLVLLAAFALLQGEASAQTSTASPVSPGSYPGGRGQGRGQMTPEQRAQRTAERLARTLALTADQTPKVQAVLLAQARENEAIRTKYAASPDRRAALPELKATKEKYDAQLQGVLTAEQQAKYAQLRNEQQQKRQEKAREGKRKLKTQS